MTQNLTTRLLTILLALLVSAPAAAQRIADLTPRSSIAEDDNFYCVADDASYQGVCDLQLIRSEIQERIHGANLQTGTTYELVLADAGKVIELANASPITLTIPANASVAFPVNTVIQVVQGGAGAVTINITSDTLNGSTSIGSQWDSLLLWKRAATEWVGIMPANIDSDAIHDNVSGEISAITEKATPVDADLLLIEDSADSNAKKRATIANAVDSRASGRYTVFYHAQDMFAAPNNPAVLGTNQESQFQPASREWTFAASGDFDEVQWADVLPNRWDGGNVRCKPYWRTTNADTGNVLWDFRMVLVGTGEQFDSAFPPPSVSSLSAGTGTSNDLVIGPYSSALNFTTGTDEELATFLLRRNANDASDTYTGSSAAVGVLCEFFSDQPTDD